MMKFETVQWAKILNELKKNPVFMFSVNVFWTIDSKIKRIIKITNFTVHNVLSLANCSVCIFLNLHNNPVKQVLLSFPFYRWENWKSDDLPTHPASGRNRFRSQVFLTLCPVILLVCCAQSSASAWWAQLLWELVPRMCRDDVINQHIEPN